MAELENLRRSLPTHQHHIQHSLAESNYLNGGVRLAPGFLRVSREWWWWLVSTIVWPGLTLVSLSNGASVGQTGVASLQQPFTTLPYPTARRLEATVLRPVLVTAYVFRKAAMLLRYLNNFEKLWYCSTEQGVSVNWTSKMPPYYDKKHSISTMAQVDLHLKTWMWIELSSHLNRTRLAILFSQFKLMIAV